VFLIILESGVAIGHSKYSRHQNMCQIIQWDARVSAKM